MVNFEEKARNKKPIGRFYGTLMMLVVCLLVVCSTSLASGFDFDNTYDYNEETKTAVIHNCDFWVGWCLNEGEVLANLTLTWGDTRVARGIDQHVGAFLFTPTLNTTDALQELGLTNLKNGQVMIRGAQFKVKTIKQEDNYKSECSTEEIFNETNQTYSNETTCIQVEDGKKDVIEWVPLSNPNFEFEANVEYEIGVFVDVEEGDIGDWVPSIMGVEIEEWSSWTESLNVNINWYGKLDDNLATTNVIDSTENSNGTASENTDGLSVAGLINLAFDFDGSNTADTGITPNINPSTQAYTISIWANATDTAGEDVIWGTAVGTNQRFYLMSSGTSDKWVFFSADSGIKMTSTTSVDYGNWVLLVITLDGAGGSELFINNVSEDTYSIGSYTTTGNLFMANIGAGGSLDGSLDEMGVWDRELSQSEITQIYNGGLGITYTDVFGVAPSVTLISPANNSNLTSANIDFITTATDDQQISNVTLYIDGVANETNSSGFNGTYTFSLTGVPEGIHNWSVLAINNNSLENQSANFTFNLTIPPIFIDLLSPADVSTHNIPLINMSCKAYKDEGVTQLNLTIDGVVNISITNTTVAENLTISQELNFSEGNYTWGCSAMNPSTSATSSNRTFEVLYSSPVVNLFSPENTAEITIENATFIFNASDLNGVSSVSLFIDGVLNETNSSGVEGNYSMFKTLIDGSYNWSVGATSTLGKITNSSTRTFILHTSFPTVNVSAPSGVSDYFKLGGNETLVYNISEVGSNSSHFDECWYNYGEPEDDDCYQESTNTTNQTGIDGDCGLNYSGSYSLEPEYFYATYKKPENIASAKWRVKHGRLEESNNTIPLSCLIYDNSDLILRFYSRWAGGVSTYVSYGQCYDGSWINITQQSTVGPGVTCTTQTVGNSIWDGNFSTNGLYDGVLGWLNNFKGDEYCTDSAIWEEGIYWNIGVDLNCSANTTSFTYVEGQNNITVFAEDEFGFIANDTSSWEYTLLEINQTFNNETMEGATETFIINLTKLSTDQISGVELVYNGTAYSFPYVSTANNIISESSITIPRVDTDTNFTFYWNITIDDGSVISTDSNDQSVSNINVDNCSVYTNLVYNFTQYDEETQDILTNNNTIELQINLYDTKKTILLTNFSSTFTNVNPVQFCMEDAILTNANFSSYVVVKYYANSTTTNVSYSIEYYNILNQTIGNTTIPINVDLYDLKTDDTTKFRLTFRDSSYVLAPNILVQVHRQYIQNNNFEIVEIPLTDSNGQTILNLVKDTIIYNFVMVNEAGDVVGTFNSIVAFCQDFVIGDCNINLAPDSDSPPVYDYDEEFDISISTPAYSNTSKEISIIFLTGDLLPKTVRMDIVRNNDFGNRSVCSDSLSASSGTVSCSVAAVTDIDQFLFVSIYVDGELAQEDTINLNAGSLNFGTTNGAFYAFLIILALTTVFMGDRKILVISLGLGWVGVLSLGLVSGKMIGFSSAGIWLLVTILIFLWKLNKEDEV